MKLDLYKEFICNKSGIRIPNDRLSNLQAAIIERMEEVNIFDNDSYYKFLIKSSQEFHNLISLLTVNETYFFRNPRYFNLFSKELIPELLRGTQAGKKIRILSAGCSNGEEPYSVAISLIEEYGEAAFNQFEVIGVDIDMKAIQKAEMGVYGKNSFRAYHAGLRERYFKILEDGKFKISPSICRMISFYHQNLNDSSYIDNINNIDIIFYRNVSIYFSIESQEKIFASLTKILNKNGYLITSPSETFSHKHKELTLVERDGIYIFHKSNIKKIISVQSQKKPPKIKRDKIKNTNEMKLSGMSKLKTSTSAKKNIQEKDTDKIKEVRLIIEQKRYEEALEIISVIKSEEELFMDAILLEIEILINRNSFIEADQRCNELLHYDPLCYQGYYLAGLIAHEEKRDSEAIKLFKKCLYIEPSLWQSHYFLAEIYKNSNDYQKALKEYFLVLRLIDRNSTMDMMKMDFTFSPEQMKNLCKNNIEKIKSL